MNIRPYQQQHRDARPAGFVAVRLHEESSMGEIHMVTVDPDHQRQGIGRTYEQAGFRVLPIARYFKAL